jgi:glycosyltransferase involved in cell wall biosynthesis
MNNMNQNPLISVVFTSYNHKEYLKQALDSLVNQTYQNLEIIIIDDCSTDGSQGILKEYEHLKNINLKLSAVNSGSYVNSSNLGASYATGEYILFAQCDDYAVPNQIEKLLAPFYNNPNIGVVYSKSNLVDEQGNYLQDDLKGRELAFKNHIKNSPIIMGNEMRKFLSFSCVIPNLSAALIKNNLFKEVGLSNKFLVVADWELWLNLSEKTNFYYLNEPLNNFRQHATTIRSKIKIKTQIVEIYSMFYNHINAYQLKGNDKKQIRIGAGAVLFSYFVQNKMLWIKSFFSFYTEIKKIEKSVFYYLFLGTKKHLAELFHRKSAPK